MPLKSVIITSRFHSIIESTEHFLRLFDEFLPPGPCLLITLGIHGVKLEEDLGEHRLTQSFVLIFFLCEVRGWVYGELYALGQ